ncbi:hypothetical protein H5410_032867 [Solanum commersonii]|uniref:Uncharacterized protein n=1 Tax=Solanum commersonii TaxID=4109 RepID=A0A9J5YM72_SOLCO|nr:hypothetical protein H5410_032867 [Solanum commersonii]
MTLQLGSLTTIVVSSTEVAKEILHKHDETFLARIVPVAITAQPNPEATLAWVNGDHMWKKREGFSAAFATTLNLISNMIFSINIVDPEFKKAHEFKELAWTIMEDVRLHEIFEENIEKSVEARAAGMKKKGDFFGYTS